MDKPQIILHIHKSVNYTAFDAKWIPCSAKFVVLGNYARGTGALQIYEVSHGDLNLVKDNRMNGCVGFNDTATHIKIHSIGTEVASVVGEQGARTSDLKFPVFPYRIKGLQIEKSKAFKCGTFGASSLQQRFLATGDFDGKMAIWNLESPEIPVYSVKGHKEIINSIDGVGGLGIGEGAPEIVTGSRDGAVKVWDPRQKNDPVATMEPGDDETKRDCWTVAFGNAYTPQERCVCAGYDNGDIKLFDLKTMSLRWETNVKNGVCGLEFDRKDINMNKLVATTLESKFHVYDMRTQHPTKGFASVTERAHKSTIWQARHLPQNRDIFMTTGGSGTLNLWKYNYPVKRVTKDGEEREMGVAGTLQLVQNMGLSTQPINSFDWSPDKEGLSVCTAFDQSLRVLIVTKLKTL